MRVKFKKINDGFLWGGSLSAIQVDGVGSKQLRRSPVIHDYLYHKYPEKHWSGIGPTVTIDFLNSFQKDIKLLSEIGINSIRYGFMWSRLFPDGENLNQQAVAYYHQVIDCFLAHHIEPMMQLFHFDSPMWVKEVGGWSQKITQERFAKFARFVFNEYGKKVKYFATFNEPAVMKGMFEDCNWYQDGEVTYDKVWKETLGIVKANAAAYKQFVRLKKANKLTKQNKLGVVINYNKAYPASDNPTLADQEAVKDLDAFLNIFWTDALLVGKINQRVKSKLAKYHYHLPITSDEEKALSQVKMDFIGQNYYLPWRAKAPQKNQLTSSSSIEERLFKITQKKNARMNKFRGWEIYPEGLKESLEDIWNRYQIPIYIGENGMGVDNEERFRGENGVINDDYRISFIKEHLMAMQQAIDNGVVVFGYHVWSMIDLWSSYNGFKNRYGFIEVNLNNNLSRHFKKSAFWYKHFIQTGEFDDDFIKCDILTQEAMQESEKLMQQQGPKIGKQNYEKIS